MFSILSTVKLQPVHLVIGWYAYKSGRDHDQTQLVRYTAVVVLEFLVSKKHASCVLATAYLARQVICIAIRSHYTDSAGMNLMKVVSIMLDAMHAYETAVLWHAS